MSRDQYTSLAPVYDRLNADIDYEAWADHIERQFSLYAAKKPESVLDLACGTGAMTVELAPGAPEFWVTWTPEVMPWSMLSTRFWDWTFRSSEVTDEMAAVTTDFFWTP